MARQPYKSTESIQMMTTRQLRQYIADKATEAQARLDTIKVENVSSEVKASLQAITFSNGKRVKRSTSYMSRDDMIKYAFDLRTFNALDTTSKYARDTEYNKNRARYEKFVTNQIDNNKDSYWAKFKNKDGSISKRGYAEYKKYIEFLKSIKDIQESYGYRNIKEYGQKRYVDTRDDQVIENNPARQKYIIDTLNDLYAESQGKGWTQGDLIDELYLKLDDYDKKQKQKQKAKKVSKAAPKVKTKKSKSKTNIKVIKARKMRTDGTIRERLT